MSEIKVLDKDQLAQLWTKMNNTFVQKNGVPSSWLASEYDKRNLINSSNIIAGRRVNASTGEIGSENDVDGTDYIEIEPSTRYINNCQPLWSSTYGVAFFTSNKTFISGYNASSSSYRDFTTPSNAKYLIISWYTIGAWKTSNPSLSKYGGGEITRANDIEPVLLWENGSPRSSFTAKPISMAQDITKFKYLYIEVSLQTSSGQGNMIFKFRSKVSNNNYLTIFDNGSGATHSTRAFTITSTTNINVSACSNGNEYCIPLRIFGSNI